MRGTVCTHLSVSVLKHESFLVSPKWVEQRSIDEFRIFMTSARAGSRNNCVSQAAQHQLYSTMLGFQRLRCMSGVLQGVDTRASLRKL